MTIFEMKVAKQRNFVAKNAKSCGGVHKDKVGPLASRARQKQNVLRELRNA